MSNVNVRVYAKLNHKEGLPAYATPGAAGLDLHANEAMVIEAGATAVVPTGLFPEIPAGYELQIRPRSGTSLKTGLRVANAPGTIDSDYRGEIGVIIHNTASVATTISLGERIAQAVLSEVPTLVWDPVSSREELSSTDRGVGGYGSTGK